jgi:hypothetical protein
MSIAEKIVDNINPVFILPPSGISTARDAKTVFILLFYSYIKLIDTCGGPVRGGKIE